MCCLGDKRDMGRVVAGMDWQIGDLLSVLIRVRL